MKTKKWSAIMKWLVLPVAAFMIVASMPKAAFADTYQYKVTVEDGGYGTITAGSKEVSVAYNGTWSPDSYDVTPTDPKYEFAGFHISGQEELFVKGNNYPITQDTIFVAAYRLPGTSVEYTVNYVDGSGNPLPGATAQKFYGTVGEKPVVVYQYFEGYAPRVLTLGKTLTNNPSDNVFTFPYDEVTGTEVVITDVITNTTTQFIDNGTTTIGGGGGGGTGGGAAGAGGAAGGGAAGGGAAGGGAAGGGAAGGGAAGGEAAGGTTIEDNTVPQAQTPEDYIDLDENEVPLDSGESLIDGDGTKIDDTETPKGEGEGEGQGQGGKSGMSNAAKWGIGGGAVVAAGAAVLAFLSARRRREDK